MPRFTGPVHVDTDCGVDDALALVLIAQLADLRSVTATWGNCTSHQAAANARYVLDRTRARGVPITASNHAPPRSWAPSEAHGCDGLGGVLELPPEAPGDSTEAAAQAIVAFAREHGQRGRLLAIGPVTSLAMAVHLDPVAMAAVGEIVVMAGQGAQPRDPWLDAAGDTNTRHDPNAMRMVTTSDLNATFVGIDQTRHVLLASDAFTTSALGRQLLDFSRHYGSARAATYGYKPTGPGWRVPAHDAVAASILLEEFPRSCAVAAMAVDDISGTWVLRVAASESDDRRRYRVLTAAPSTSQLSALVQEALSL